MNSSANLTNSSIPILPIYEDLVRQTSVTFMVLFPLMFFVSLMVMLLLLINYGEGNLRNTSRILIYLLIEFIAMPFLFFFLILNSVLILFSYFFCKNVVYVSTKNVGEFLNALFEKCRNNNTEVINVKRHQNTSNNNDVNNESKDRIVPNQNRADKYKDNDESKENNVVNNNTNVLNILDNKDIKVQEGTQAANTTMNEAIVRKRGKVTEFIKNFLMNEDNTPSYINFIRNLKNKTKENQNNDSSNDMVAVKVKK